MSNQGIKTPLQIGATQRIEYVDAMRGLAMVMVVVSHCCVLSFCQQPVFNGVINSAIQIPLFFMISGFFAPHLLRKRWTATLADRFVRLVVPALLMLGLYCWITRFSFVDALADNMKNGYWFTLVLFGYTLIYLAVSAVARRLRLSERSTIWLHIAIGLVVAYCGLATFGKGKSIPAFYWFSTDQFFAYFFFIAGALMYAHREIVFKLLNTKQVIGGGNSILYRCAVGYRNLRY